jgi:outer membrane receptor protein involved in Fe transport
MGMISAKHRLSSGISAVTVAIALCVAQPAGAQTLSTIRGEHATPGATVTAINTNTGERSSTVVSPDGRFVIVGVRPGAYRLEGAGETTDIVVPVGQTVSIDAAAAAPATEEGGAIVVRGRRDRTEVRSATVTTNVSTEQIENLPQNDRNFLNFAQLAPGVQVTPNQGARRVQAGALSADQTNVYVDGTSFKNNINHGGISGQNFSEGNPFPQLAVQEFKVDTQNFKAEYEQAGSAIITAVTKTGGTEFHGDVFGQFQPKALVRQKFFDRPREANNRGFPCPEDPSERCYREKPDYKRWQYGGDLGGPIIKEKLHFFLAFEGLNLTRPSTAVSLEPPVPQELIDEFNGSYPQDFKQKLYFGKLTAFATDDDTIDASAFIRDEENLSDFGDNRVPTGGRLLTSKGHLYQVDWKHRGDNWLNELIIAYQKFENGTPLVSEGPEIALRAGDSDVALLGANNFVQDDNQKSWTIKNNFTWDYGDHVIKAGVKVAFQKLTRLVDDHGNGTYRFDAASFTGFDSSIPTQAIISTRTTEPASVDNKQIGLFVQDDWSPDDHWTVNVGLRWDFETDAKNEDFVTPANIAAALRAYPGWQAAGIDAEDYISDGDNRKPFWGAFQPRIGVSYDVHGDRDLVFFVGAGRYYDRPLFLTSAIETFKAGTTVNTVTFCGAAGQPVCPAVLPTGWLPWNDSYRDVESLRAAAAGLGLGGEVWLLNNKTKLPYSDQFNVGVRKRFGDWQTSLTFSHIRSHNIFHYSRGNRFSNGWYTRFLERDWAGNVIGCTDGGLLWVLDVAPTVEHAAGPATKAHLSGFVGKLNIGSNDGKARYTALYLQAEKPYTKASGWGVTGSFTYARARSNVSAETVFPNTGDEIFNAGEQTAFGWQNVEGVPKWQFVGTGIVGLPLDITLSGTLVLSRGPAFGQVLAPWNSSIVPPDGACCYVNNGGLNWPDKNIAYKTFDARIAKTFKMPWGGHELTAEFQVYNMFDWVNRTYSAWGSGAGDNPMDENDTRGSARAFQAGLKYSF